MDGNIIPSGRNEKADVRYDVFLFLIVYALRSELSHVHFDSDPAGRVMSLIINNHLDLV